MDNEPKKRYERIIEKLNISSPNLEFIGPSSGSSINGVEISGVLAGLSDIKFEMGWMFITQDYAKFSFVALMVLNEASKLAVINNWKVPKKKYLLRRMSELAVIEALAPKLCKNCRGHGQIFDSRHNLIVECKKCHGTGGGASFSKTRRAKILDMSRESFVKKWSDRYDQIFMVAYGWLMDVFTHINDKS